MCVHVYVHGVKLSSVCVYVCKHMLSMLCSVFELEKNRWSSLSHCVCVIMFIELNQWSRVYLCLYTHAVDALFWIYIYIYELEKNR